jgi:Cu(I)/Ag(I) efflux system periplasmic protein CusF
MQQKMKYLKQALAAASLAISAASVAHAQGAQSVDRAARHVAPAAGATQELLSEGEVRKVNREAGKITLRHGPLANLDMPAMTMVFTATDPKLLDGLKEGDKVRFTAGLKDGTYLVTAIRIAN